MTGVLETLAGIIAQSGWLAPLLALAAGILTSFTPCSLSGIPLVIAYVGGVEKNEPQKSFWLSVTFAAGSAVTFTLLGVAASLAGRLIGNAAPWWYIAMGVLMVLMALQTWGIVELIPSSYLLSRNKRKGTLGALIAGILGGIFSSPCATPVLVALLALVAGKGSILWGILLLLLYSIGHGILAIVAGTSVGLVQKLGSSPRYAKTSAILKIILGTLILFIGFYLFYLGF